MAKKPRKEVRLHSKRLAINGGAPVRKGPWSEGPFHFTEEAGALRRVLSGPCLSLAMGENVLGFRERIKETYGVKHVVTASSGSAAIHVALKAAGVEPGDEVITSPLTDYGSVIGILQLDAIPVFCDVIEGGILMDPVKIEPLITSRTRVIMPVHNGGYCADMRMIMKISKKRKIKVIEDCAQAHMAKIGDAYAGCFGDFGCFSTNESKHIKTGEGGFIICRKASDARYSDLFSDKCYPRFPGAPRSPAFPALNVRMSEVNAAIGIEQMKKLPGWIKKRNAAGVGMEEVVRKFPLRAHWRPADSKCSYWWFAFYMDATKTGIKTSEFLEALNAEGIPCWLGAPRFIPEFGVFRKLNKNPESFPDYNPKRLKKGFYSPDNLGHAKSAAANTITVPVNQHTSGRETEDFERALEKIFG